MYDNISPRIDNEAPFRNIIDYKKKETSYMKSSPD